MKSDGPSPDSERSNLRASPALTAEERAERVSRFRAILASKQLTVYKLANLTKLLYGAASEYFIKHNFTYYVVSRGVSPHICQVIALSRLTGYSIKDWLELFGFPPDMISSWQWYFHSDRTTLLSSGLYDRDALIPFLGTPLRAEELDRTAPLSSIAKYSMALSARKVETLNSRKFLYARIGKQDTLGFPDLVSESIVRIDPFRTTLEAEGPSTSSARPLYLVEYPDGVTCCHVQRVDRNFILLAPHLLEFERLKFRLGREAVILGTVDAEIRPLIGLKNPTEQQSWRVFREINPRKTLKTPSSIDELIRNARERMGLSFAKAHEMSLQLALALKNYQYQLASSWIREMEITHSLPRRIEKIFSLCIIYHLDLRDYLRAGGLRLDQTGQEPFPPQYRPKPKPRITPLEETSFQGTTFTDHLERIVEEIPLFLQHRFPFHFGQQEITARELYWFGQRERKFHPVLNGAVILAVNATSGRDSWGSGWKDPWERPLYLVMQRDGRYLCGFCAFTQKSITLVPHPDSAEEPVQFASSMEGEVVGRVAAVARVFR
jgi:hypothetical protein